MLDRPAARLRYAGGNAIRTLTRPWRERCIAPELATTIFACSFGADGWHHIRRTLAEFDADPSISPADSSLGQYLARFCPSSISTLAGVTGEEPLPLFVYPWGTFNDGAARSDKDPWSSRFSGPSTAEFIADEFHRTIQLYRQVKVEGYQPTRFPHSYICGTWLLAADGRRRFVVMQGNHRMAILAHLGAGPLAVRTFSHALASVRESDIAKWPLVASRRCSPEHAKRVFDLFFNENGWHVARTLAGVGSQLPRGAK